MDDTGSNRFSGFLALVAAFGIGAGAAWLGDNLTVPAVLAATFLYLCLPPFGWMHAAAIWVWLIKGEGG